MLGQCIGMEKINPPFHFLILVSSLQANHPLWFHTYMNSSTVTKGGKGQNKK
jgi:hypothetical protein